jgi:phage terminase large subunit-like protein
MLVAMLMNFRPRATALFLGPTQAIADRAYEQAVGMIDESPDLKRRFRPRDHLKTIEDLVTKSEIMVATFDLRILTGAMALVFVLLDELHVLGKAAHTSRVLRQIRGGLDKTQEGVLVITTTQSDDIPAGAFKSELKFVAQRARRRLSRQGHPPDAAAAVRISARYRRADSREERLAGVEQCAGKTRPTGRW